ncbi:hypothetical protein D3C72_1704640 [compost metagenome]
MRGESIGSKDITQSSFCRDHTLTGFNPVTQTFVDRDGVVIQYQIAADNLRRCKLHLRAFFERQKITQAIVLKLQLGHFLEAGIEFVIVGF